MFLILPMMPFERESLSIYLYKISGPVDFFSFFFLFNPSEHIFTVIWGTLYESSSCQPVNSLPNFIVVS